jgi:lipid-A-disaccharide synthase
MRRSRLVLVASGTATLQSALLGTPMVIVYRVSPLNYFLASRLVKIKNIGLVNVVLGERVAPEFVQGDATPGAIAGAARKLLIDGEARRRTVERFATLRDTLAGGGGCARVAEMAGELMGK